MQSILTSSTSAVATYLMWLSVGFDPGYLDVLQGLTPAQRSEWSTLVCQHWMLTGVICPIVNNPREEWFRFMIFSAYISENRIANQVCRGLLHSLCMKVWTKGRILFQPNDFLHALRKMLTITIWMYSYVLSVLSWGRIPQLFSNTSGHTNLSILVKITSKNQKSELLHCYTLGSL